MSYAKTKYTRSNQEIAFIFLFIPTVFFGYSIYKFPDFFVDLGWFQSVSSVYFLGKSPSFWYSTLYTGVISFIALKVLFGKKSPYKKGKKNKLSSYQRNKFLSIFIVQFVILYLLPYFITPLMSGQPFFQDPIKPLTHDAYVYISKGFTSIGSMVYVFVLVPLSVYFFGKRYCSWFCACGNLAEAVGVTKWGAAWVKHKTPTGKLANKLESLQTVFMIFGLAFGFLLFFDIYKIFSSPSLLLAGKQFEVFVVDFAFGALVGVGAYPFLGTRIWCRYGCPLAKMMEFIGRYGKSKFQVAANDNCKGLDLCSQVCPMGIDVANYAHQDKKPIQGSFGLIETPCVGCGGCVDICPVDALSFTS